MTFSDSEVSIWFALLLQPAPQVPVNYENRDLTVDFEIGKYS